MKSGNNVWASEFGRWEFPKRLIRSTRVILHLSRVSRPADSPEQIYFVSKSF